VGGGIGIGCGASTFSRVYHRLLCSQGVPPAAETDGPVGVSMLAMALQRIGAACRVATDEACRATCAAALQGTDVPMDVVPLGGTSKTPLRIGAVLV